MHLLPHSVPAVLRLENRLVEQAREIIDMHVGPENHVAAAAAIAAIRPTLRHELFATKTYAATATVAGLGLNFDSIDKHGAEESEALKR